jgi:hypothetical protein
VPTRDRSGRFMTEIFIAGVLSRTVYLYYIYSHRFSILSFLVITCHRMLDILRRLHEYFQTLHISIFMYIISHKTTFKTPESVFGSSLEKKIKS